MKANTLTPIRFDRPPVQVDPELVARLLVRAAVVAKPQDPIIKPHGLPIKAPRPQI